MPTEVCVNRRERFKDEQKSHHPNAETMSGNMTLVSMNGRRQGVHVKVYRTSLEHFCVLYPQKKICRPMGVLNLKNTRVERLDVDGITVRQLGFDTPMALSFVPDARCDVDDWIVAFTNRGSPTFRHSALPIVEEDEEVWINLSFGVVCSGSGLVFFFVFLKSFWKFGGIVCAGHFVLHPLWWGPVDKPRSWTSCQATRRDENGVRELLNDAPSHPQDWKQKTTLAVAMIIYINKIIFYHHGLVNCKKTKDKGETTRLDHCTNFGERCSLTVTVT